jgi:hypothetical protein
MRYNFFIKQLQGREMSEEKVYKTDPKILESNRAWREANKEKYHEIKTKSQKAYYERVKEDVAQRKRERLLNDPEYAQKKRARQATWYRNKLKSLRSALYEVLGAKCSECGFSDTRALCVHHINGGGTQERTRVDRTSYVKQLLEKAKANPTDYQVLCANCHTIKHFAVSEPSLAPESP